MAKISCEILDKILPRVNRPGRYVGGELNAVYKDWEKVRVRMVFAFPDVYEIGMSHLGLHILYGLGNEHKDYLVERVFAPWTDMEDELRKRELPLFSLESRHSLVDFDLIGFTLQYEMSYTNIINMLDLGKIPLKTWERTEEHPLVIAGGSGAMNAEPLTDFIDAFILGEGEEILLEILEVVGRHCQICREEKKLKFPDRKNLLMDLARIPGVYIPSFYTINYHEDGTIKEILPCEPVAAYPIARRVVADLNNAYFPLSPVVPNIEIVHDRIMLEVFRGCQRGCRFCQAGMLYRPTRERKVNTLIRQAKELVHNTGYSEISLTSLSTGDYSEIQALVRQLLEKYQDQGISVSLPSLRIDSFSVGLAREIQKGRKTGITFAPEAGTQRLRDVINKGVTEANLFSAVQAAFRAGWSALKLYFMIGLPFEEKEDLDGIVDLAKKVADLGTVANREGYFKRPVEVSVSVSNFVPKAHTPFQWTGQLPVSEFKSRQEYLRQRLRDKRIKFKWHDAELSFWEAVLARGDRRLGKVLERAWQKGCRLDSWSDFFQSEKWKEATEETGIDPEYYANRTIPITEVLPWDHLSSGVAKKFLIREYEAAKNVKLTEDCRWGDCSGCGVCASLGVNLVINNLKKETRDVSVSHRIQ